LIRTALRLIIISYFLGFMAQQCLGEAANTKEQSSYEILIEKCMDLYQSGKYEAAISVANELLAKNPNSVVGRICMGSSLDELGNSYDAIRYFKEAEELAEENDHLITIYNRLSDLYAQIREFDKAIYYNNLLLNLSRSIHNKKEQIIALTRLAEIMSESNKFQESLSYYRRALELEDDPAGKAIILNAIANIYVWEEKANEAIVYYKQALDIEQKLNNTIAFAQTMLNLGNAYRIAKEYKKSEDILTDAMQRLKEIKDEYWEAVGHRYIAWLYRDLNKKDVALVHLQMAKTLYEKSHQLEEVESVNEEISQLKNAKR